MHQHRTSPATLNAPFGLPRSYDFNQERRRKSCRKSSNKSSMDSNESILGGVPLERGVNLHSHHPKSRSYTRSTYPTRQRYIPPAPLQTFDDFRNSPEFRRLYEIRDDLYIAFEKHEDSSVGESMFTHRSELFTHIISIRSTSDPNKPYIEHVEGSSQQTLILNIAPPSRKAQQAPVAKHLTAEKLRHTQQFISGAGLGMSLERLAALLIPAEHDTEETLSLSIDQMKAAMDFMVEAGYQLDTHSVDSHPKILITVPRGRKMEGMCLIACFLSWLASFTLKEVVEFWDADANLEDTVWYGTISRSVRRTLQRDLNSYDEF